MCKLQCLNGKEIGATSMKIHYNPRMKELAKQLRKNSTLAEVLLWRKLKGKQMLGYDFHRQKPIENYIVDFFCPRLNLVIEIDGQSHDFKSKMDAKRQNDLENMGLDVLRFSEGEVRHKMNDVLFTIEQWIRGFEENKKITHP